LSGIRARVWKRYVKYNHKSFFSLCINLAVIFKNVTHELFFDIRKRTENLK